MEKGEDYSSMPINLNRQYALFDLYLFLKYIMETPKFQMNPNLSILVFFLVIQLQVIQLLLIYTIFSQNPSKFFFYDFYPNNFKAYSYSDFYKLLASSYDYKLLFFQGVYDKLLRYIDEILLIFVAMPFFFIVTILL